MLNDFLKFDQRISYITSMKETFLFFHFIDLFILDFLYDNKCWKF